MIWPFRFLEVRRNTKRGLFPYYDGTRVRWGDPYPIYRKLASGDVSLEDIAPFVDEQKEPQTSQALDLICKAFDATRWDDRTGRGLTDMEIMDLPHQMGLHVERVKKNSSGGST